LLSASHATTSSLIKHAVRSQTDGRNGKIYVKMSLERVIKLSDVQTEQSVTELLQQINWNKCID